MFHFLTHVELSRSIAAILEMPQYMAYQKNAAFALFTLSTKSHTFNRYCTIMPFSGLSYPTIESVWLAKASFEVSDYR